MATVCVMCMWIDLRTSLEMDETLDLLESLWSGLTKSKYNLTNLYENPFLSIEVFHPF